MGRREESTVSVGDWVESYSPGIWKVIRVLSGFYETRFSLQERKRISKRGIVFVKRLVDDRWVKSFKVESCSTEWARPLSMAQQGKLDSYIALHADVIAEFDAFRPQLPGLLVNFGFHVSDMPSFDDRRVLVTSIFAGIEQGFTNDEILERIAASALARYRQAAPTNTTVQFVNREHELRDGQFLFRGFEVLPF